MPRPTPQQRRVKVLEPGWLRYTKRVRALAYQDLIGYWPMGEANGLFANDASGFGRAAAAYTGVDLGLGGIGDGRTAPLFDGVNDYCNIYSAGLASAFNGLEGSFGGWFQVSGAGVWTDSTSRDAGVVLVNGSNYVQIARPTNNGVISCIYTAGGTVKSVSISGLSTTGWIHLFVTWSKSGDAFKAYLNGAQSGATQTGLGTFAGALSSTRTVLGATSTTPTAVTSGYLAHWGLWTRALSAAEVAALYQVIG